MSNRYREYFENITPDESLVNDTIRKMQEEMSSDKKPLVFNIKPVAAVAACVAVTASAIIFSPGMNNVTGPDGSDQSVENITETASQTEEPAVSSAETSSAFAGDNTEPSGTEPVSEAVSGTESPESASVPAHSQSRSAEGNNSTGGQQASVTSHKNEIPVQPTAAVTTRKNETTVKPSAAVTTTGKEESEIPQTTTEKPVLTDRPSTAPAVSASPTVKPTASRLPDYAPTAPPSLVPTGAAPPAPTMDPTMRPTMGPQPTQSPGNQAPSVEISPSIDPDSGFTGSPGFSGGDPGNNGGTSGNSGSTPPKDTPVNSGENSCEHRYVTGYDIALNSCDSYSVNLPSQRTERTYEYAKDIFGGRFLPRDIIESISECYSLNGDDSLDNGIVITVGDEGPLVFRDTRFINLVVSANNSSYGYRQNSESAEETALSDKDAVFSISKNLPDVYFCTTNYNDLYYTVVFKGYSLKEAVDIMNRI